MRTLTGPEYVQLLLHPEEWGDLTPIRVTSNFELPKNLTSLPTAHTIFDCDFGGGESQLEEFNHEVLGYATFAWSALKRLGPQARFAQLLDIAQTGITELNCEVPNLRMFGAKLKEFGPNAGCENVMISSVQLMLLAQLKKRPKSISVGHTHNTKEAHPIEVEINEILLLHYQQQLEINGDAATAILDACTLVTSPKTKLLAEYNRYAKVLEEMEWLDNKPFLNHLRHHLTELAKIKIADTATRSHNTAPR